MLGSGFCHCMYVLIWIYCNSCYLFIQSKTLGQILLLALAKSPNKWLSFYFFQQKSKSLFHNSQSMALIMMCDLESEGKLQRDDAFIIGIAQIFFFFDCSIYTGYMIVTVIDIVILGNNLNWYLHLQLFTMSRRVLIITFAPPQADGSHR